MPAWVAVRRADQARRRARVFRLASRSLRRKAVIVSQTCTSSPWQKSRTASAATRRPVGVAALIVSFNTPLPNYAWKAFPAVFCGNAAVLKPSEHTPASAAFFGELCGEFLPAGVLNVVQGLGGEAGPPLVESPG